MPRAPTGIYKITNLYNNKVYIGQTGNLGQRRHQHFAALRSGHHENRAMQADYKKYSRYFRWDIIEFCELDQLNEREIYWINKYNSFQPFGYNAGWHPYTTKRKKLIKRRKSSCKPRKDVI